MRKFDIDPPEPRQSFSHARIKPVVLEEVKRRTNFLCPSCGAKMRLVRQPELAMSCPRCENKQAGP